MGKRLLQKKLLPTPIYLLPLSGKWSRRKKAQASQAPSGRHQAAPSSTKHVTLNRAYRLRDSSELTAPTISQLPAKKTATPIDRRLQMTAQYRGVSKVESRLKLTHQLRLRTLRS
jgi:hypothetical protein